MDPASRVSAMSAVLEDLRPRGGLEHAQILAGVTQRLFGGPRRSARLARYELGERLGHGAFSVVWAGRDPQLDREVAIKLVRHEPYDGNAIDAERRLVREARALAQLDHPNVVRVFDVGSVEGPDGVDGFFVVMERVFGRDLSALLSSWVADPSQRSCAEVLRIFTAAGRGLAAVHAAGLVHRDVKPANVLVGDAGEVKLADFGLARTHELATRIDAHAAEPEAMRARLTADGAIVGTPLYMAPEQHRGEPADARSDQYAFCVALFEALFGRPPFASTTTMAALAQAKEIGPALPRARDVAPAIARAIVRGMAPDPDHRWPDVATLIDRLHTRRATTRRVAIAAAIGLAVLPAFFSLAAPSDPCADVREQGMPHYDDDARDDIARVLTGHGGHAVDAARRLDAFAQDWLDARLDACEQGVAAALPAEVIDLQHECLHARAEDVRALVGSLRDADPRIAEHAIEAVVRLPPPRECLDRDRLLARQGAIEPPSADSIANVTEIRARLREVDTLATLGRVDASLALARQAHADSLATGYAPLVAESEDVLARELDHSGMLGDAEDMFAAAYLHAQECGHDRVAMKAAVALAFVVGVRRARHDDGLAWLNHARSAWQRAGSPPEEESGLLATEGSLAMERGELKSAERRMGEALASAEANGATALRIAVLSSNHGLTLAKLGELADARAAHERALAIRVAEQGEEHPAVARILYNLGTLDLRAERFDDAQPRLERALAIRQRALGPEHVETAVVIASLGDLAQRRADAAHAGALYREALPLYERAYGRVHPNVADLLTNLGEAKHQLGDLEGARADLDRAIAIYQTTLGPDAPVVANPLTALGTVLCELDRPREAVALLEHAVAIRQVSDRWHRLAETQTLLARAHAAASSP